MEHATEQGLADVARLMNIRAQIDNITYLPAALARKGSAEITRTLGQLEMLTITTAQFGEFAHEAAMARDTTISALMELREGLFKKEQTDASMEAERARQDVQRQNAMGKIRELQELGVTNGSAAVLKHVIDSVAATSILAEEFGIGLEAVKNAQTMALDTLRPKYERAVIDEGAQAMRDSVSFTWERSSEPDPIEGYTVSVEYGGELEPGDFDAADDLIDEADAGDDEIILAVAHHFGWSRKQAVMRLATIDFQGLKP